MPKSLFQTAEPAVLSPQKRRSHVIVGTGVRIGMFTDPILRDFPEASSLVALCDLSQIRMRYHQARFQRDFHAPPVALYPAAEFDRMLDEQQPDVVIVCTVDAFHDEYILRSIARGCDVICEKPITTTAEKCRALLKAIPESGHHVRVTFNMRWMPGFSEVKRQLRAGAIGTVRHVHFEYLLNTIHGADYFRRWHSQKASSGGLLVHKSTHHFDMVNWLLEAVPATVYAQGGLVFYGRKNALARGDKKLTEHERYTGHSDNTDPFHVDLREDARAKGLYLDAEKETGYLRDRNVFRDGIDIEDTVSVMVRYNTGAVLNYSLNAFCPYEGFRLHLTGDRGRLEYEERREAHLHRTGAEGRLDHTLPSTEIKRLTHHPLFQPAREIPIESLAGGHGGGDPLLQAQMFAAQPSPDDLGSNAGYEQGIASAIIGIAANQSISANQVIQVNDLLGDSFAGRAFSDLI